MPTLLDQLLGNGDQAQPNTAQQILSARFQPEQSDVAQSIFQNTTGFNGSPNYTPVSPQQIAGENQMAMIKPYAMMQAAQGQGIANNIQQQTGLPMAQADLQKQLMANQIQQQTGMQGAQADIGYKNAMANSQNSALQRDIAEKQYQYQNDPQMAQSRMMAQYMQQMSGLPMQQAQQPISGGTVAQPINASALQPSSPLQSVGALSAPPSPQQLSLPQTMQQNAQVQQPQAQGQASFNPMGAMLAKQFGLENMQIGPNGQPQPIPGVPTKGQQEQDSNFAQSWQTYINQGGDKRLQNSLDTIDQVIGGLKNGDIKTGGIGSRAMTNPEGQPISGAQLVNPDALVARNLIASAILPQAKALFGARVTNFDAQSLISSQGLDMMASKDTNISKLQKLKNATIQAQQELNSSGQYFQQHGTLAGYQPQANTAASAGRVSVVSPDGQSGSIAPEELQAALANGWKQAQ